MLVLGRSTARIRRYRVVFALTGVALLCVPLVAMQFTSEVNWQIGDFAVFAAMLLILGASLEVWLRSATDTRVKAIGSALCLAAFVAVWALLATG